MVDVADLSKISALYAEVDSIERAIANFDAGGMIVQMAIAPPPPTPAPPPGATGATGATGGTGASGATGEPAVPPPPPFLSTVIVDTRNIEYPPQMKDGIIQQLRARQATIDKELTDLGVTGLTQQPSPIASARSGRPQPAR